MVVRVRSCKVLFLVHPFAWAEDACSLQVVPLDLRNPVVGLSFILVYVVFSALLIAIVVEVVVISVGIALQNGEGAACMVLLLLVQKMDISSFFLAVLLSFVFRLVDFLRTNADFLLIPRAVSESWNATEQVLSSRTLR